MNDSSKVIIALPFIFSILLKVSEGVFESYIIDCIVTGIPEYRLTSNQKATIANLAVGTYRRITYIITLGLSATTASVIAFENHAFYEGVIAVAILIFGLIIGSFVIHSKDLNWLQSSTVFKGNKIRRVHIFITILIITDLSLMVMSLTSDKLPVPPVTNSRPTDGIPDGSPPKLELPQK